MERPLERGIPPWEMYVLTAEGDGGGGVGGEAAGGGRPFAVLVKLHHALADGIRAVAIGAGIFDQIADARAAGGRRARPVPPRSWLPGPWQVAGLARGRIEELGRAVGIGASVVRASRLDPRGTPALTAGSSGTRRLATALLDLEDVQRIRRAAGGTANDVLLATVAGALRRWMLERGEPLPAAAPRALVPVSRRRPGSPPGSGNRLSAYLLALPLAEADPGPGSPPYAGAWTATSPTDPRAGPARWPSSRTNCRRSPTGSGRPSPAARPECSSTSW